jgi:homopolymeric O-antigen transport system permease protein
LTPLNSSEGPVRPDQVATASEIGGNEAQPSAPVASRLLGGPSFVIESEEAGVSLNLRDIWTYRELLYFLIWRDLRVRYKQTAMGAAWVIIQPLLTMLILTAFLHRFAGVRAGDIPYPLFAYAGLWLWTFFANSVINGTNNLISNTNLITKVYFPRAFIPAAAVGAGLVDLAIASLVLIGLMVFYGVRPTASILLAPLFVAVTVTLALAVGMLISALTVKYRDLRHALPFIIQFWMFSSPVIYPASVIPEKWRWLLMVNPITGPIEGLRATLMGQALDWPVVLVSGALTGLLLVASFYVFRRIEDTFADLI